MVYDCPGKQRKENVLVMCTYKRGGGPQDTLHAYPPEIIATVGVVTWGLSKEGNEGRSV